MPMPSAAWRIVQQMFERFASSYPASDAGARQWTHATIEQLAFSVPDGGWCAKRASLDRPESKDCVARQIDGRFEGWDVLIGADGGPVRLADYPPTYHDLRAEENQVPIIVTARNHLLSNPLPPSPEPPSPLPSTDLADLMTKAEAELAALRASVLRDGDHVSLRTANAHVVCAEGGGGGTVNATRIDVGAWEIFLVEKR
jgi:hypothetical protein